MRLLLIAIIPILGIITALIYFHMSSKPSNLRIYKMISKFLTLSNVIAGCTTLTFIAFMKYLLYGSDLISIGDGLVLGLNSLAIRLFIKGFIEDFVIQHGLDTKWNNILFGDKITTTADASKKLPNIPNIVQSNPNPVNNVVPGAAPAAAPVGPAYPAGTTVLAGGIVQIDNPMVFDPNGTNQPYARIMSAVFEAHNKHEGGTVRPRFDTQGETFFDAWARSIGPHTNLPRPNPYIPLYVNGQYNNQANQNTVAIRRALRLLP